VGGAFFSMRCSSRGYESAYAIWMHESANGGSILTATRSILSMSSIATGGPGTWCLCEWGASSNRTRSMRSERRLWRR